MSFEESVPGITRLRKLVFISGMVAVFTGTAAGASATPATHRVGGAYEKQMLIPGKELRGLLTSIPKVTAIGFRVPVAPTAARTAAAALRRAEVSLSDATKRLESIVPPAAAVSGQAELKSGASNLETELKPIIARLDKGYLNEISTLPSLLGMRQIASALATLKKHGYQIGK